MGVEFAAVEGMLDEIHETLPVRRDQNAYTFGKIGVHNVVVAVMPETGENAAASVITQLLNDFDSVRFGMLVGIGGGVPGKVDIRLGDVVVSKPTDTFGGVVQYDLGKRVQGEQPFQRTGLLNKPPKILSAHVQKLDSRHQREGHRLLDILDTMLQRYPRMKENFAYPAEARDSLFHATYIHISGETCDTCDRQQIISRSARPNHEPQIHYGTIGSANIVLKDAVLRDSLRHDMNIICVEMEAAGLMNDFPCLVVRGICDYADSHKNKRWQPYAAAVAAAYTKELLQIIPAQQVVQVSSAANRNNTGEYDVIVTEILASLAFPQMRGRQLDVQTQTRHPNTCQWILDLPAYRAWSVQPYGLLWIKGKPGAGKSTTMSFLYTLIQGRPHTTSDVRLEFFFSARGVELQHTFKGMLRSLLNQLLQSAPQCRHVVGKYYQEKCDSFGRQAGAWEWHDEELKTLLLKSVFVAAQYQQVLIFVDALDEAGESVARTIAEYFHSINNQVAEDSVSVKICISCRHYPIVSTGWGTEICVEEHNRNDIAAYVQDRFNLIHRNMGTISPHLDQWLAVQKALIDRTRGVFLWVRLVMEIIEKCLYEGLSPEEVWPEVQKLPNKLGNVYEHILSNVINPRFGSQSFLLFQWVYLAEEPLTVRQMRYALAAIDSMPQSRFSQPITCEATSRFIKTDKLMKDRVSALSGGLLEVVNNRIQAGHQTINEFLMQRGLLLLAKYYTATTDGLFVEQADCSTTSDPSILVYQCQSRLYWSCLKYLATEMVALDYREHRTGELASLDQRRQHISILMKSPLISYATRHVFIHAEKAKQYRLQRVADQIELINRITLFWITMYQAFEYRIGKYPPSGTTSLHIAAGAGLDDIVAHLLQKGQACDHQDDEGNTALHVAARRGHEQVVNSLIRAGSDVNRQTSQQRTRLRDGAQTPLALAVANGHVNVVHLLLQEGAKFDNVAGDSGSELQIASHAGHTNLVLLFLAFGVDPNARGGEFGSALYAASAKGHEGIVRILLKAGADLSTREGFYGSALNVASAEGHENVVRVLLKAGADLSTREWFYGSALYAASLKGRENIVKVLLKAGADVNAREGYRGSALNVASVEGRENIVRILLEAGADVNLQEAGFDSALQAASREGHENIVRMLFAAGADISQYAYHFQKWFPAALQSGKQEIIQKLIDVGADVHVEDKYRSSFQDAIYRGLKFKTVEQEQQVHAEQREWQSRIQGGEVAESVEG